MKPITFTRPARYSESNSGAHRHAFRRSLFRQRQPKLRCNQSVFYPVDRNSTAIDVGDLEARAISILHSLAQNFKDKKKK